MRHFQQAKLVRLHTGGRTARIRPFLLRHFSADVSPIEQPHAPEAQASVAAETEAKTKAKPNWVIANELLELLQSSDEDWNQEELHRLVSTIAPTNRLVQVIRRLGNSAKAVKFFEWIQKNNSSIFQVLSSPTYHAIFDVASREPNSHLKLSELFHKSKEQGVPLSVDSATLLIRRFERAGRIDDSCQVFNDVDPSTRDTHLCNTLLGVLLRSDRIQDAQELLHEMLQQSSSFPPNDLTGSIVFSALLNRNLPGRAMSGGEVTEMVSKLGEHDVFPDTILLTKLVTKLCRSSNTSQAWELLHSLMRMNGPVEVSSCNALLAGLGREWDFQRMTLLLAEMKEMGIKPTAITFGILIHHLCKMHRVDEALEELDKMTGEGERMRSH